MAHIVISSSLSSCGQAGTTFLPSSHGLWYHLIRKGWTHLRAVAIDPWILPARSFNHSLVHSFHKWLLSVYYGTAPNTGGKVVSKTTYLCLHGVFSLLWKKYMDESYPCDGHICLWQALGRRELGLEGEIREELKEERRMTSKMGLGELSRRRTYYKPRPPTPVVWEKAVSEGLRVRKSKGGMRLRRDRRLGSGF